MRLFTIGLWFRIGQHHSPPDLPETTHMLEHLSMRGPDGEPEQFAERLERDGSLFNAVVHREWTAFTARVRPDRVRDGLVALRQIAFEPVGWTDRHLEIERNVLLSEISAMGRDLSRRLTAEAKRRFLPKSPYALSLAERQASLNNISLADVCAFRQQHLVPRNAVLFLAGPGAASHLNLAAELFLPIPGGEPAEWPGIGLSRCGERLILHDRNGSNAIAIALPAPAYPSPDRDLLVIAQGLLVHGMASRLYREAVLKRGLTYEVRADAEHCANHGVMVIYARLRDGKDADVFLDMVERNIRDLTAGHVSPVELQRARERYITHLLLSEEDPEQLARRQGRHLVYTGELFSTETTIARLRRAPPTAYKEAWSRYLGLEKASIIVVTGERDG